MNLTPKQEALYNRSVALYSDKGLRNNDATQREKTIYQKIKTTYDVEMQDYTDDMIFDLLNDVVFDVKENNLFTRYIMPPFSTLDSRSGDWRVRRQTLDRHLGSSLVGRPAGLVYASDWKVGSKNMSVRKDDNGTSQFDSVLCELLLKWFGFKNCAVLDPFAGGHVRGALASLIGYSYTGLDLNPDQIAANNAQGNVLGLSPMPNWIHDDARNLDAHVAPLSQDLLFTCPPYGDLEQYTSDARDLSNMDYKEFTQAHWQIIGKSAAALKEGRFAVWVVGDFRDSKGMYRGFVADTIKAFESFGMPLYNEAILLNSVGTASMRASGMFANRKLVKIHQNVLVFFKGDPKYIQMTYGAVDNSLPVPSLRQEALF